MKLEELASERKWYDLTQEIKQKIRKGVDSELGEKMNALFIHYIQRIHPTTIASTAIELTNCISPNKSIELIDLAIKTIAVSSIEEALYAQEIISLRLYRCLSLMKNEIFEDIETQLIAMKKSDISNENLNLLYLVSSTYYQNVGNIENAQENLLMHARQVGFMKDAKKLVILSIVSKSFYDFAVISSFKEFNEIDEKLKNLFLKFQNGEISGIDTEEACKLLGLKSFDYLNEKIYLVKILKICFQAEQKFLFFDQLIEMLELDEISTIHLLLRALGLKIVNGWIDSEKRIFYFNSVLPRALNMDEISKMKFKFMEWKLRVEKVLEAMEE